MGNVSGFGIGTYQSISGSTQVDQGFPTQPFQLASPFAGNYGGTYGFVLDTTIRAPNSVQWTPAPEIGLDGYGASVTRGFPQISWQWQLLRYDAWYQFMMIYQQSARTQPGFQYLVLLRYPDPLGSGILAEQLAHMDPPTFSSRTVAVFNGVQLKFTYIGQASLDPGTPIQVIS